jgi:hypothetical protein
MQFLLFSQLPSNRDTLGRGEERVAKLVDSPDRKVYPSNSGSAPLTPSTLPYSRPESEATYKLDEGGWSDV